MKYSEIKRLTSIGNYQINVFLRYVKMQLDEYINDFHLDLNPDFQRGHIWTTEQQVKYVEFLLKGGKTGRIIYFNCPGWHNGRTDDFVVVDGLQRLTALMRFCNNEIKAFGHYEREFEGIADADVIFNVNNLKTRKEVLQWYLELNSAGTPHTKEELDRVRGMLSEIVI